MSAKEMRIREWLAAREELAQAWYFFNHCSQEDFDFANAGVTYAQERLKRAISAMS